jgi:acylphosphatase
MPEGGAEAVVVRRRVVVRGRVQGVGFRMFVASRAESRGVAGRVRNCADGAVEAELEGERDAVAAVVAACEAGPRGAHVSGLEVSDEAPTGMRGFEIR